MIRGIVNARLQATIRLPVQDAGGNPQDIEVVIDTGFSGSLTLPPPVIAGLGLVCALGEPPSSPRECRSV